MGMLALAIFFLFVNSTQIEKRASTHIITAAGGLGDSLFAFQKKYPQFKKITKDDIFIAYSFQSDKSKLEVSFFNVREAKAFQINVSPSDSPQSADEFVSLLQAYTPSDSVLIKEKDNGDEDVYYYKKVSC